MIELKLRIEENAFEQIRADCRHYYSDEPPSPRLALAAEIVKAINVGQATLRIFSRIAGAEHKPECLAARTLRNVEEAKRIVGRVKGKPPAPSIR